MKSGLGEAVARADSVIGAAGASSVSMSSGRAITTGPARP